MSDYQQKDMEGVLFKNDDKTPENKQPDYSGSVTVKGVKYNLGAWINTSKKSGKKFMGLKVQPWGQKQEPKSSAPKAPADFPDDDLGPPF